MTTTVADTRVEDRIRWLARGLGQVLITLGVIMLLFVLYELWFTGFYTQREQHQLRSQLEHAWAQPQPRAATGGTVAAPAVDPGDGMAILRVPRLGKSYAYVVVEGVSHDDLKKGPGHYPGTALPGQVGNFVVSGHRTTYLAPFERLDELHGGDRIVVQTRDDWFVYRVTRTEIVQPTDMAVIAPVPDHPGERPTQAMLTFTTCNPKYSASTRLIVHARLDQTETRTAAQGPPPFLEA